MNELEKSELWTLCLESSCRDNKTLPFDAQKAKAGELFRAMRAEIGAARPDFNGIRARLGY